MTPRELKAHKQAPKKLEKAPEFKPQKRNRLPRPFKALGGPRIQSTGMLDVSADHRVLMYWRDGPILTDRSFFAYLFCRLANKSISPIFEFHWHPNHKGMHCKLPCRTINDYTDRTLPGAPELSLKTDSQLDPKIPNDLAALVIAFCEACGIQLPNGSNKTQPALWS